MSTAPAKTEQTAYSWFMHMFMHFWGYMVIPLGMSGDQVGMNGDEGGRGWGGRRFGERYSENKGLSWKNMQNSCQNLTVFYSNRTPFALTTARSLNRTSSWAG